MNETSTTRRGHTADEAAEAPTAGRLVAAGRKVFARRGYDGASVRAITREARANLGAVTYHFGSKLGLYEAVLSSVLRPLAERVREAARGPGNPLDRMERVVRAFFEHLAGYPDMPQLMLQEIAAGKRPPAVVAEILGTVLGTLASVVREGQEEGVIGPGEPPFLALSVVAQPVHLTLTRRITAEVAGLDHGDPAVRAQLIEHAVRFVRAGLTRGAPVDGEEAR